MNKANNPEGSGDAVRDVEEQRARAFTICGFGSELRVLPTANECGPVRDIVYFLLYCYYSTTVLHLNNESEFSFYICGIIQCASCWKALFIKVLFILLKPSRILILKL